MHQKQLCKFYRNGKFSRSTFDINNSRITSDIRDREQRIIKTEKMENLNGLSLIGIIAGLLLLIKLILDWRKSIKYKRIAKMLEELKKREEEKLNKQ